MPSSRHEAIRNPSQCQELTYAITHMKRVGETKRARELSLNELQFSPLRTLRVSEAKSSKVACRHRVIFTDSMMREQRKATPLQYPGMRSPCAKNAKTRLYGTCFRDTRRHDCFFATSNGPSAVVQFIISLSSGKPLGLELALCVIDNMQPEHGQMERRTFSTRSNSR
jgi:hypothetical protein